ncbi:hypothetical protein CXF30_06300 [Corynebacterium bovis]|nr:hypothetical protein CXF30_06300 [Corynebacterium bovis]
MAGALGGVGAVGGRLWCRGWRAWGGGWRGWRGWRAWGGGWRGWRGWRAWGGGWRGWRPRGFRPPFILGHPPSSLRSLSGVPGSAAPASPPGLVIGARASGSPPATRFT